MIDKIGNTTSVLTPRPQSTAAANALRTISTLNAVAQKSTRASSGGGSSGPAVKVFSVNQTASNTPTSNQVPRGSLVDELV